MFHLSSSLCAALVYAYYMMQKVCQFCELSKSVHEAERIVGGVRRGCAGI